jgi:hypothetical protein
VGASYCINEALTLDRGDVCEMYVIVLHDFDDRALEISPLRRALVRSQFAVATLAMQQAR